MPPTLVFDSVFFLKTSIWIFKILKDYQTLKLPAYSLSQMCNEPFSPVFEYDHFPNR